MSTLTKLDPAVRIKRAYRRAERRALAGGLRTAAALLARGLALGRGASAEAAAYKRIMGDLTVKEAVLKLTLKHITAICLDPSRTGARKQAVLDKLAQVTPV